MGKTTLVNEGFRCSILKHSLINARLILLCFEGVLGFLGFMKGL